MSEFSILVTACAALPVGIMVCARLGHRAGRRLVGTNDAEISTGIVDAAVLSLLRLLTAFTFSGAYGRFDHRRSLIVDEANAIGTAYLRLDLLPADAQSSVRAKFREYVKSRQEVWRLMRDRDAALAEYATTEKLQGDIWTACIEAANSDPTGDARKLLLPALNEMIDITTTRLVAVQSHPPTMIFAFLGILWLAAGAIVGFSMAKANRPSRSHVLGFALIAALAMYVIVDMEFPRYGLITLDAPHGLLEDLENQMN